MAGRGTDIKLGPGVVKCQVCGIESDRPSFGQVQEEPDLSDEQVAELGCQTDPPCGLQILGTERHESRRIDRQLRGRSGRQGDPGSARFFLSLEDDLMRVFGSERIAKVMDKLGAEEGEVITHPWVTKSIEKAQRRVEMQNFEARKKLLEYDDVNNQQREAIYDLRLFALQGGDDLKGEAWEMIDEALRTEVENHVPPGSRPEEWDLTGLRESLLIDYFLLADFLPEESQDSMEVRTEWSSPAEIEEQVVEFAHEAYDQKLESFGEEAGDILRFIVLSVIDDKWKDHLYDLDQLRDSIRYRAYGQRDPEVEYKKEAFEMFVDLMRDIRKSVANLVFRAQVEREAQQLRAPEITEESGPSDSIATGVSASDVMGDGGGQGQQGGAGERQMAATGVSASAKTEQEGTARADSARVVQPDEPLEVEEEPGRNDPCPCGSGDKYKNCHGSLA